MRGFRFPLRALPGFFCLLTATGATDAGSIGIAIPQITATRGATLCAVAPGGDAALLRALDEFRQAAVTWNVEITALPYQDSRQAAEDFRAGVCDLVNLPGDLARDFNRFSATLEAVGALPDDEHLRTALRALALDKATPLLRSGDYEVVSVWPDGARHLQLGDKQWRDPAALAGHTLAGNESPETLAALASLTGMTMLNGDSGLSAPAADLWAGEPASPADGAGLLELPLSQRTQQIIARHALLPAAFGQQARHFAEQQFDHLQDLLAGAERQWPDSVWIRLEPSQQDAWNQIFQQARVRLRNDGVYDASALTLLRKVRCALDAGRLECGGGSLQVE